MVVKVTITEIKDDFATNRWAAAVAEVGGSSIRRPSSRLVFGISVISLASFPSWFWASHWNLAPWWDSWTCRMWRELSMKPSLNPSMLMVKFSPDPTWTRLPVFLAEPVGEEEEFCRGEAGNTWYQRILGTGTASIWNMSIRQLSLNHARIIQ